MMAGLRFPATLGAAATDAAPLLSRVSPWVTLLPLGIVAYQMLVASDRGTIAVSGRAAALAHRTSVTNSTTSTGVMYAWTATFGPTGGCAGWGTFTFTEPTVQAIANDWAAQVNSHGSCFTPSRIPAHGTASGLGMSFFGADGVSMGSASAAQVCPAGYTLISGACQSIGTVIQGGTQEWSPVTLPDPGTGEPVPGWEAPTDPLITPATWSPANPLVETPIPYTTPTPGGTVKPRIFITPRSDGGVTTQTWYPEVSSGAVQSWTVQTVTIVRQQSGDELDDRDQHI